VLGVPASFLNSISFGSRDSNAHTIPHGAPLTVEVPSNRENVFPLFLTLLYKGECKLTLVSLPPLLSIAVFSDPPLLCDVLRHFVRLAILDEPLKENHHESQQWLIKSEDTG
jgi:hypothetical protein